MTDMTDTLIYIDTIHFAPQSYENMIYNMYFIFISIDVFLISGLFFKILTSWSLASI